MAIYRGWGAFSSYSDIVSVYYANGQAEWNLISIGDYNEALTEAARYCGKEDGVTGGGRLPVEATISVDNTGNAEVVLEIVDETLTVDDIMVFAVSFFGE